MSVAVGTKPVTAKDFEKFDPDWRYDLMQGELRSMPPPPGAEHGSLTMQVSLYTTLFAIEHGLGACFAAETRFIIAQNPDTVLAPDWAFIAKERLPERMPTGFLALAPDIVLEVRSPSDRRAEVLEKANRWLEAGVRLVWELNPKTQILTVYRPNTPPQELNADDTLTGDDVLPGFTLPLRRLFPA